jgi:hypothetical protein
MRLILGTFYKLIAEYPNSADEAVARARFCDKVVRAIELVALF